MAGKMSRILLTATVTEIGNGSAVYPACRQCYCKLMTPEISNNQSKCPKCNRLYKPDEIYHRFRLCATITDFISSASITAFGGMLDVFFGTTASQFHKKLSSLKERYFGLCEELVKLAIERTFVGQSLLFGFKVNSGLLKEALSQLPHQQILLSDVVSNSMSTGPQGVNKSKSWGDLVAVQVVQQEKHDGDFKTVTDSLSEFVRFIDETHKVQQEPMDKESLRDAIRYFYTQSLVAVGSEIDQNSSIWMEERSQAGNLSSDSSLNSGSDLSSIRLSCDSSIHKIKQIGANFRSLANITNISDEKPKSVSVMNESTEGSKHFSYEAMLNGSCLKTEDGGSKHSLRRSKRILEKKNRTVVCSHTNVSGDEGNFSENSGEKKKKRSAKKLGAVSWCTRKQNILAKKAESCNHESSRGRTSSPINSCLNVYKMDTSSIDHGKLDPADTGMKSKISAIESEPLVDSLCYDYINSVASAHTLHTLNKEMNEEKNETNYNIVAESRSHFKDESRDVNKTTFDQETLNTSHSEHISRLSPTADLSRTLYVESDMEITKNIPCEGEQLPNDISSSKRICFCTGSENCTCEIPEALLKNAAQNLEEVLPESEDLSAFLRASQFNTTTTECGQDQKNNLYCSQSKVKDPLKVKKSTQECRHIQEKEPLETDERAGGFNCFLSLNHINPANLTNVTLRHKNKYKKGLGQQFLNSKLNETSLSELSSNHTRSEPLGQLHGADLSAYIMDAPGSEDLYAFLEDVKSSLQNMPHLSEKCGKSENSKIVSPPEKTRPSDHVTESIDASYLADATEVLQESGTGFDTTSNDFDHSYRDCNQIDPTDAELSDSKCISSTEFNNKGTFDTSKLSLDKHQQKTVLHFGCDISTDNKSEGEDNSCCISPPLNSHLSTYKTRSDRDPISKEDTSIESKKAENGHFLSVSSVDSLVDTSSDLFDDSCVIPSSSSEQFARMKHGLKMDFANSSDRDSSIVNSDSLCPSNYKPFTLSTPTARNKRVRFKRRRKEILFHDFEIISHLPVPSLKKKDLKSCLKKAKFHQNLDNSNCCSQDLFESPSEDFSLSKSLEVNMISKNHSQFDSHMESSHKENPKIVVDSTPPEVSGSQDLFSSGESDLSEVSPGKGRVYISDSCRSKTVHLKIRKDLDFCRRTTDLTHVTSTSKTTDMHKMCSRSSPQASENKDTNRYSLDLFSPSCSQTFSGIVSSPGVPHLPLQLGKAESETPDLFSTDSD